MSEDPKDVGSPEHLAEIRWAGAYKAWRDRDPTVMAQLLRDPQFALPANAREFLADLVAGKVHRKSGRPPERDGWVERSIAVEVFKLLDVCHNKSVAIAAVAARRTDSDDGYGAIKGVMDRLDAAGLTYDNWVAWGRPDWLSSTKPRGIS